MCGRYSLFTPPTDLEARFEATFEREFEPTYNAAPSQDLPVITGDEPDSIQFQQWGLVPEWADEKAGHDHINARAETIDEKPTFADSFQSRRCLVLADGFYEWTETSHGKQPHRVAFEDDRPFAMAGLWARWTPPQTQTGLGDFGDQDQPDANPDTLESFTIVTTEPNDVVSDLHHRMAVILSPEEEREWLTADSAAANSLLDPHPGDEMRAYPVSTAVNNPANDSPALVEEVELSG